MRFTISKNGIQERVNYLIGTNDTDPSPVPTIVKDSGPATLTDWSAQASMITNIRRLVRGITGQSLIGKIMSGLQLTQATTGGSEISISNGIGFTVAGNIIILNKNITKDLSTAGTYEIYLLYQEAFLDPTVALDYHTSEVMGTSLTPINILADDICSNTVNDDLIRAQIAIHTVTLSENDGLYLGTVEVTGTIGSFNMTITPANNQAISKHLNGSFQATLTNFDTIVPGVAYYEVVGNICTVRLPELHGNSNATTHKLTGIPDVIIPSVATFSTTIPISMAKGIWNPTAFWIDVTSEWGLTATNGDGFAAGNTEGIWPCTIMYYL
jgi:hypothetical protein